jgi:hypothetical protein
VYHRSWEINGKALGARVGGKLHTPSARNEFMRQRFGWKQMTPGSTGGK